MSDVKAYYDSITSIDIGTVARELLGNRVCAESDRLLRCDCPHHQSESKQSLHIMLDKRGWYCFGCQVGGDVLQLVEFLASGQVTRGQNGTMPKSHRDARDYLAQRVGLASLAQTGRSPEEIAELESRRREQTLVRETMTAIATFYHEQLVSNPEVLDWFTSHYAIGRETIDGLRIGYADGADVIQALRSDPHNRRLRDLAATGAFVRKPQGGLRPFFNHRVVFPYWNRGQVAYMIGRKTPWTLDKPWEEAKYKKLPGKSERHPYVSPAVRNDTLYNEDCLSADQEYVVITEGVTDCIALMERGIASVSPVTVKIRKRDWPRLVRKLRGVKTVYLCQDNEHSEVGLKGALEIAAELGKHDVEAQLIELPPGEGQEKARSEIEEWQRAHSEEDIPPELLAKAKIDVNAYFLAGHTAADFEALMGSAKTPLQRSILQLSTLESEDDRRRALEPIMEAVAKLPPIQQEWHLKLIQKECAEQKIGLSVLRDEVRGIKKKQKEMSKNRVGLATTAPPGSCAAAIAKAAHDSDANYAEMAEAAFEWLLENGGRPFRTVHGEPFLFFGDRVYWMDSSDRGRKRLYQALIYDHTGIVPTTTGGRTFYEVLADLTVKHGEIREQFSWLHTEVSKHTVYFNLNNEDMEIAKITPDGVEILKNGGNDDGIILESSRKLRPIRFIPEVEIEKADCLLHDLIETHLACREQDRSFIVNWLSCFLLLDFVGTRPMARFEGSAASGKTTAVKMISTLFYGAPEQKKSTDAANYTDGSQNPLIALDNVESKHMTEDLTTFFLTSITGIVKEKRKSGTDTETIVERTKCLLCTNGIEPLGAGKSEILSRSFIVRFDRAEQESDCFLEAKVIARIREQRDLILSALMMKTSQVLALIRDGAQERCMRLLHRELGDHGMRRCSDYLSLMYLITLAGNDQDEVAGGLEELQPRFAGQIEALNATGQETARETNDIVMGLSVLFKRYRNAAEADERLSGRPDHKGNVEAFIERYQLDFAGVDRIEGALAREIQVALSKITYDFRVPYSITSTQQFVQRLRNDLVTLEKAGFVVTTDEGTDNYTLYNIRLKDDGVPF